VAKKKKPATHLRIEMDHDVYDRSGSRGRTTLWCEERTLVNASANFDTTENPVDVTCRKCIKAGGCGPGWKSS
jgi:hypothetical protein